MIVIQLLKDYLFVLKKIKDYWKDSKVYSNNVSLQDVNGYLAYWGQAV